MKSASLTLSVLLIVLGAFGLLILGARGEARRCFDRGGVMVETSDDVLCIISATNDP
jgi:hypothetical protein